MRKGDNMKYQPPYTITAEILNRVVAISFGHRAADRTY